MPERPLQPLSVRQVCHGWRTPRTLSACRDAGAALLALALVGCGIAAQTNAAYCVPSQTQSAVPGFSALGQPGGKTLSELEAQESTGVFFDSYLRPGDLALAASGDGLDMDTLERYRCTGFLEIDNGGNMFLWTSLHCFKPTVTHKIMLNIYRPASKDYVESEFETALISAFNDLRETAQDPSKVEDTTLAQSELDILLTQLDERFDDLTAEIVQKCIDTENPIGQLVTITEHTRLCINGMDSLRVPISLINPSAEFLTMVNDLEVGQVQTRSAVQANAALSAASKTRLANWGLSYDTYTSAVASVLTSPFAEAKNDLTDPCAADDKRPACAFAATFEGSGLSATLSESQARAQVNALELGFLDARPFARDLLEKTVAGIPNFFQSQLKFFTHLQIKDPNDTDFAAESSKTLGTDGMNSFRHYGLGLTTIAGGALLPGSYLNDLGRVVEVFFPPKDAVDMFFQGGDSGTMLLFMGAYPIGNLSTVDGIPRTGGLVAPVIPAASVDPTADPGATLPDDTGGPPRDSAGGLAGLDTPQETTDPTADPSLDTSAGADLAEASGTGLDPVVEAGISSGTDGSGSTQGGSGAGPVTRTSSPLSTKPAVESESSTTESAGAEEPTASTVPGGAASCLFR